MHRNIRALRKRIERLEAQGVTIQPSQNPATAELIANALAAENVRRYLDGTIIGPPNEGTLADRVHTRCTAEFIAGELRATESAECECYPAGRPSL